MNSKKLKLASATIGASALVGMGVFTVALSSDNDAATPVSQPEITLGETTTSTTAALRARDAAGRTGSHGRAA